MLTLTGTGVALVTPFRADGAIDFPALERLLVHTHAEGKGVEYWVVMGTTGESVTLSKEEKQSVLDFVRTHNPANKPILYGIGGNYTQEVLDGLKHTNLEGVSAILSVSPYYNKPSQAGIIQHFTAIADASPLPIVLYNVPGRTASNLKAETTLRLAEHKNIIATKEASGDLVQCTEIARYAPAHFSLISGDDLLTVPTIAIGGKGVISVLANAFPANFSEMTRQALAGNFAQSTALLHGFLDINPLMYEEANPVGVKQVLEFQGVCSNHVRLPLLPATESLQNRIKALLK
jgi:4-hydroxy-tetrahydrodipicolinate synthase